MTRRTAGAAVPAISALLAVPAPAQTAADPAAPPGWVAWDSDGDGRISREEFDAGLAGRDLFNRWNRAEDAALTRNEFEAGFAATGAAPPDFAAWDTDGDGLLTEGEFGQGLWRGYDPAGRGFVEGDMLEMLGTDFGPDGRFGIGASDQRLDPWSGTVGTLPDPGTGGAPVGTGGSVPAD
ncbi:EF-hand domain-containing protein [Rubellimicrobium sp. CFH 75288]|uniref:EF-hand domain-containing protein n=1 Tax=Rubellimicrobium sp. CFH 75288 TaxID=2697034 RepID=UPI001412B29F|nr:EF-hand domain-containing protein [Rubellimicrobium sp. CFH 75288]NAZ37371.1 hypothetical protein [Rubellimicrobium sp. CFH 75288]